MSREWIEVWFVECMHARPSPRLGNQDQDRDQDLRLRLRLRFEGRIRSMFMAML